MGDELNDILAALAALVTRHDEAAQDPEPVDDHNFRCVDCKDCRDCHFCTACDGCLDCTYCDACHLCENCTQSRECRSCVRCTHTVYSGSCEASSYLSLCYGCEACIHCFACVGLSGEEFFILNKKFPRKEYFATVASLRRGLDAHSLSGWQPPWVNPVAAPEPCEPAVQSAHETMTATLTPVVGSAESTGSFPPRDHDAARAMDALGHDDLWDGIGESWGGISGLAPTLPSESQARATTVAPRSTRSARSVASETKIGAIGAPVGETEPAPHSIRTARRPSRS